MHKNSFWVVNGKAVLLEIIELSVKGKYVKGAVVRKTNDVTTTSKYMRIGTIMSNYRPISIVRNHFINRWLYKNEIIGYFDGVFIYS